MRFLQPLVLWGLPLVGLPILVHLIHRRRTQTVQWGAMMFLLEGARLSKGMQRLRHFLLLTLRTLAVLGLVLGIGRPLSGGWLGGLGGGRPDVVVVLLDRSASMSQRVDGRPKLELAVQRVAQALEHVEASRLACVESVGRAWIELEKPEDLLELPVVGETSTHADLLALLELTVERLRRDQVGRAEIWIGSDGQSADWSPDEGRWPALQEALLELPAGVRLNVLNLAQASTNNLSVRVDRAQRREEEGRTELVLDLRVQADAPTDEVRKVPLTIDLGGARSVVELELLGAEAQLRGHRIAVEAEPASGWGFVELQADDDPGDDRAYFTYGGRSVQETLVVAEDAAVAEVLALAAECPTADGRESLARVVEPRDAGSLDLSGVSLLVWQAPLPEGERALAVEAFLAQGGQVLLLPPESPGEAQWFDCGWGTRVEHDPGNGLPAPTSWRHDGDLLRDGADGTPLSLETLELRRVTPAVGDLSPLANLPDGTALLSRAPTDRGGLYFLSTTPSPADSNLATQGLALIALVQRCLEAAAASVDSRASQEAGTFVAPAEGAERVSEGSPDWLLSEQFQHAGVVRAGEALIALNRPESEDRSPVLADERLLALLPEVDVRLVSQGSAEAGLVEEVWRLFLLLLLAALVGEALLCMRETSPAPLRRPRDGSDAGSEDGRAAA